MNGRKCKYKNKYQDRPEAEWEIYVVNWEVSFVSNEKNYDGNGSIKTWYKYSCILFNYNCKDYISEDFLITFIDEQKHHKKNTKTSITMTTEKR